MRGAPGGGRGFSRGGPRGGGRGFRGGGRGGAGGGRSFGPPAEVTQVGIVDKVVEGKLICNCTHKDVPILRRKVYFQNKNEIGSIDDVFGTVSAYGFVVELNTDLKAESFKSGDIIYGDNYNMLPLNRFLEDDKKAPRRPKDINQQGNLIPFPHRPHNHNPISYDIYVSLSFN